MKLNETIKQLTELYMTGGSLPDEKHMEACQTAIKVLEALDDWEMIQERLEVISGIYAYYVTSKGAGHTRLMMEGVSAWGEDKFDGGDKDFLIVIGAENQRSQFNGHDTVLYDKIHRNLGINRPLAWDNFAILRMVSSLAVVSGTFRQIARVFEGSK